MRSQSFCFAENGVSVPVAGFGSVSCRRYVSCGHLAELKKAKFFEMNRKRQGGKKKRKDN